MWSEGVKRKHIAARVGVSVGTVVNWCRDIPAPVDHRAYNGRHLRRSSRFNYAIGVEDDFEAL